MRKIVRILATFLVLMALVWWIRSTTDNSRGRAEREHGIGLPASARDIQCRGNAWRGFLDRGAATMFEMDADNLTAFVNALRVESRTAPAHADGDPTVNGFNVWPTDSPTAVPGNGPYGGFRRTWQGEAVPVEMLSCASPTGDWLHVELWRLGDGAMLVKMYTDWN